MARRRLWLNEGSPSPFASAFGLIQSVDKRLDEPHRVVGSDVIVNRLREKEQLRTIVTGKVCHAGFYRAAKDAGIPHVGFSHGLQDFR